MKIQWGVDKHLPQSFEFEIPDEDFEGLSEEDKEFAIIDYVQDELLAQIRPHWKIV